MVVAFHEQSIQMFAFQESQMELDGSFFIDHCTLDDDPLELYDCQWFTLGTLRRLPQLKNWTIFITKCSTGLEY